MHFIQKSIKDWIVKSLQKSILLRDFSDFIEVFDFSDGFTIQSQSDYKMIWDQISLCDGTHSDTNRWNWCTRP